MLVNYCWCLHSKIEWFDHASWRVMTMNLNVQCIFSSVCWQPLWTARPLHCQVLATIKVKHLRFFRCYSIRTLSASFFRFKLFQATLPAICVSDGLGVRPTAGQETQQVGENLPQSFFFPRINFIWSSNFLIGQMQCSQHIRIAGGYDHLHWCQIF